MKFDTIIIGGGLTGLVCGISLVKKGQSCVIISAGQSALHFSSGSLDLLNALPDGTAVGNPLQAVGKLTTLAPKHPYAKLGTACFEKLTDKALQFLEEVGVAVVGQAAKNHYRVTPMGTLKPTWLTLKDQLVSEQGDAIPWKKVAIFNVTGFLDFYTQFIADEFHQLGTECSVHFFSFPALEHLRKNPTEMRSTNIARLFDKKENLEELVQILKKESGDAELIVLPAITGLEGGDIAEKIENEVGKPVRLISTLPPSVPGIRMQQQLKHYFQQAGGVYMLGDTVLRAEKEGNRIARIFSCNHGDIPFVGQNIVLASGSYFSQGLIATAEQVYEPVFNLDVDYNKDREQWYELNVFAKQRYESFGVKTDVDFKGICQGKTLDNLYVAGAVLEGFNAIKEGCGAGVSMLSALYVADQILKH